MTIPQAERRLTIPEDVYLALEKYAKTERERMHRATPESVVLNMITPLSLAQHILKNEVQKHGYWEPKKAAMMPGCARE